MEQHLLASAAALSGGGAGLGRNRTWADSAARQRAVGPGAGPIGGNGRRPAMLYWGHLIRSDSGQAGQVVDRAGLGQDRPPGDHQVVAVEAGALTPDHGVRDAAPLGTDLDGAKLTTA
jgi:hypothetical protein